MAFKPLKPEFQNCDSKLLNNRPIKQLCVYDKKSREIVHILLLKENSFDEMYVKDRLPELRNIACDTFDEDSVHVVFQIDNYEKLEETLNQIGKIRSWIIDINERTSKMKMLCSEAIYQTSKQMQEEVESNLSICAAVGLKIGGALKEFQHNVNEENHDVVSRIIHLQYVTTSILYSDALKNHDKFLTLYQQSRMNLLKQQIKLANQYISDEECQGLLESNNVSIFVENIEAETIEARLALQDVEIRHKELIKIENAIKGVRDLFMQMATLVVQQQDLVNTVEYFSRQTIDNLKDGNRKLQKGFENKRKSRKKQISVAMCLLIGALIVLLILIFT